MRPDASSTSVTQWIDRLKAKDPDAAQKLWERYFHRLVGLARRRYAWGRLFGSGQRTSGIAWRWGRRVCLLPEGRRNKHQRNKQDRGPRDHWILLCGEGVPHKVSR